MRARKVDSNQSSIVSALRSIPGVSVAVTSGLGGGYPDLNVGWKGQTFLIELKDGSKSASRKKLTKDEEEFKKGWTGHYSICESLEEILKVIGIRK